MINENDLRFESNRQDKAREVLLADTLVDVANQADCGVTWATKEDLRKSAVAAANRIFNEKIKGGALVVIDDPFKDGGISPIPALREDEYDLLSDDTLKDLCRLIVEDQVSCEVAAMGLGLPPATVCEYMETGAADIASGFPTRKAIFAQAVFKAQYQVIKCTVASVRSKALGWQNYQFLLASMFPNFFSEKRMNKKETQQSAALEALQRQLGSAMQAPVQLPPRKS